MRILFITSYFPPENGAAAHLFHDLGKALVARGHQMTVATGMPSYHVTEPAERYRGQWFLREMVEGMQVIRVASPQSSPANMVLRGLWQLMSAGATFVSALSAGKHDVALVYSPPLFLGLSAWLLQVLHGTRFVLNVQDLFPQSAVDLGALRNQGIIGLFEDVERFLYQRASGIVVHSEGNKQSVAQRGADAGKIAVVRNWIDPSDVKCADSEGARRRLGLQGGFVATFAGVVGLSQDLDVILRAAKRLEADTQIQFVIAGDGMELARICRLAKEMRSSNVRFMPMLSKQQYFELLAASDAGLVTLKKEVTSPVVPSKINSIMAAGRPVMAALRMGSDAATLVMEAACGKVVECGDDAGLSATLLELKSDSKKAQAMGKNGERFVNERLSSANAAERFEEVFRGVSLQEGR
jgi:colanic acid biosynthesis glycosyl transferase WcaI